MGQRLERQRASWPVALGGLGETVIVRGLFGVPCDLVAIALDESAVLAEDDQGIGLRPTVR